MLSTALDSVNNPLVDSLKGSLDKNGNIFDNIFFILLNLFSGLLLIVGLIFAGYIPDYIQPVAILNSAIFNYKNYPLMVLGLYVLGRLISPTFGLFLSIISFPFKKVLKPKKHKILRTIHKKGAHFFFNNSPLYDGNDALDETYRKHLTDKLADFLDFKGNVINLSNLSARLCKQHNLVSFYRTNLSQTFFETLFLALIISSGIFIYRSHLLYFLATLLVAFIILREYRKVLISIQLSYLESAYVYLSLKELA